MTNGKSYGKYHAGLALSALNLFFLSTVLFFLPLYFFKLGFGGYKTGILLGTFAFMGIIAAPLAGYFLDRYNSSYLFITGAAALSAAFTILSRTADFSLVLFAFVLAGTGHNIFEITLNSLVMKTAQGEKKGRLLGLFFLVRALASVAGMILGAFFIKGDAFEAFFKLLVPAYLIFIFPAFFIKKIKTDPINLRDYKADLFDKKVLIFILLVFLFGLHWGAEDSSYTLFLQSKHGLSKFESSLYMALPICILGLVGYLIGLGFDRGLKLFNIMLAGMLVSGAGFILFVLPSNLYLSNFFRIIHEIGDALYGIAILFGASTLFPTGRLGGNFGLLSFVMVMAKISGALIFAPIGAGLGYDSAHIISGSFALFAAIAFILLARRTTA